MGLMESPMDRGRLVITPHPVLLDGQRNIPVDVREGETLRAFITRHVDIGDRWEVAVDGEYIPASEWATYYPKVGQMVEVRGAVGKSVLAIVAMIALFYFTLGAGGIAGGSFLGLSGAAGYVAASATYVLGSALINKALGPKPPSISQSAPDATHSLTSQRNTFRAYEPVPLLLGKVKITPDLSTDQPYNFTRGNDQYLALILNCGINVDRVEALYSGDALLSSFEGVEEYYSGFPGMTEDSIPLYSNTDTIAGGTLDSPAGTYIQRTSSADAIRLEVDLEYNIYDFDPKGKPRWNDEGITAQYRAVGSATWLAFGSTTISGDRPKVQRKTLSKVVPAGQYEVQVKRNGTDTVGSGAHCEVAWAALRSVQADSGNYKGLSRIGLTIKATGQLNGSLDQVRCVAYAQDVTTWDGTAWVTSSVAISNPGAQILQYARGYYDADSVLIAGMGLDDAQIDLDSIKAFILHCEANGYTFDYYLKDARSHNDVLNAIALAGFGQVTWAGGKLGIVYAADDQPLSGVVNMATIKRGTFQVEYTFAGGADGIEFTYLDATDWENKTLRIPAPGVTTPLNPARIAGEGITSEARAAEMARYHLAQHVYQYKSVGFGADLEHLSYRRLSVLALQHDLTQWGHGGRVQDVTVAGDGTVTVDLDEPVPAGATPYIGLRIPGELVYRVFEVVPLASEAQQVELVGLWPADLSAVPGDSDANPAHDTIWIYDFATSTPGKRVRVVDIQPESGGKGASVAVVPEDDAFWTYVKTGSYTPSVPSGMPTVRPVVSNVQVDEQVIPQGGTAYTELHVTFDVTGRMDHAVVLAQYTDLTDPANPQTDGEVRKVAETRTREASFRIPGNGQYDILVRPYSVDGVVGGSAIVSYTTTDTDAAPPPFDTLTVTEADGGLRHVSWAYNETTIPPPDIAGAVIRYAETTAAADPWAIDWALMDPLGGEDGFHPLPFDTFDPPALAPAYSDTATYGLGDTASSGGVNYTSLAAGNTGHPVSDGAWWSATGGRTWVFAAKPRTANGIEPDSGEPGHDQTRKLVTLSDPSLLETVVRIDGDAGDALAAANAAAQAAIDQAAAALASAAAMIGAPAWSEVTNYSAGQYASRDGIIYKSKAGSNLNHQPPNATYWTVSGTVIGNADATAATVNDHETRIDTAEGNITSTSTTLSGVLTQVNNLETDVSSNSSAISGLQSTVSQHGTDIAANASAITSIQSEITGLEDDVATNAGAISSLTTTVNGKNKVYYQATAPTSGMVAGDLWIESDNKNKQWRYDGTAWVDVTESDKVRVYVQGTKPALTGRLEGDIWINTADSNKMYVYRVSASDFVLASDSRISANATAITALQSTVNDPTTGVAANATAIDLLETEVTQNGSDISSVSSRTTALESTVNDPSTGVSATASAVQTLDTEVTTQGGYITTMRASYSLTLNVNGYASGIYANNDGTTSSLAFDTDSLVISKSGGVNRLEWSGGVLSAIHTNTLKMGSGFGVSSQMVMWYGANQLTANCTFSNAIWAVDVAGKLKAGGLWGNFGSGWSSGGTISTSYDASSPATVSISVAAGTYKVNGVSISYNASSGNTSQARGTDETYYLYYSDAGLAGGSKSLQISTNPDVQFENTGYLMIGQITVSVPAAATGGSLPSRDPYCVAVEAWVQTTRGLLRARDVLVGDEVIGPEGPRIVSRSETIKAEGVRLTDTDGHTYTCSADAQWMGLDGLRVVAAKAMNRVLRTADGWCAISAVEPVGKIEVQWITAQDGWFYAGDGERLAAHHNLKSMPE